MLENMSWWSPLVGLGYPGVFLLSFIGASSVIFPIPYTTGLLVIGATGYFNSYLLAVAAGLGAGVGEFVGYSVGYAGRGFTGEEYEEKFEAMLRIFKRYGPPAVFVFALTPLPDDLLFIPLGFTRYSFWKAFIPCILGKFLMSFILIRIGVATGQAIAGGWLPALITTVALILVMVLIFRLDWVRIAEKFAPPG